MNSRTTSRRTTGNRRLTGCLYLARALSWRWRSASIPLSPAKIILKNSGRVSNLNGRPSPASGEQADVTLPASTAPCCGAASESWPASRPLHRGAGHVPGSDCRGGTQQPSICAVVVAAHVHARATCRRRRGRPHSPRGCACSTLISTCDDVVHSWSLPPQPRTPKLPSSRTRDDSESRVS
jgi:hypothetical protein